MKKLLAFLIGLSTLLPACNKTLQFEGTTILNDSTQTVQMVVDSLTHVITIFPSANTSVDATPEIDSAINYNNNHVGGYLVIAMPGYYYCKTPPVAANIQNGVYKQVTFTLEGFNQDATDAPAGVTTNFVAMYDQGFGLGIQQGKGCTVLGIAFYGRYTKMNTWNAIQIDTTSWYQLYDGVHSDSMNNPYTGIAIDPFSDPVNYTGTHTMYANLSQYYLAGMSTSGSTNITIQNCRVSNYVLGIGFSIGFQANGDFSQINSTRVDECPSDISFTSAQNKADYVNQLMSWGQSNTIFDGRHFGAGKGDGQNPPIVTGTSIAGNNYQIFDYLNVAFPLIASNVYAEGICKIGSVIGPDAQLTGWQVDFQDAQAGLPSPDFYWFGSFANWQGCMLRVYNGGPLYNRIVLNSQGNQFTGGDMSSPPICKNQAAINHQDQPGNYPTVFNEVFCQYTNLLISGNGWDSTITLGTPTITINSANFTGYFYCTNTLGTSISVGDALTFTGFLTEGQLTGYIEDELPMGWVSSISLGTSQDTVYLRNTAMNRYTGTYTLFDQKLKAGY